MTRPRPIVLVALAVAVIVAAWLLIVGLPKLYRPAAVNGTPGSAAPAGPERKINATLFFVSEDGLSLVPMKREVAFGEPIAEQAKRIIEAQLIDSPAPLANAVPPGTTLRAVFVSDQGDAFIDLSADVTAKHPGGALDELFTVYSLVNALTVNLPAVKRVQILIGGKEADTLAGHVDLRHPLQKSLKWVKTENEAS
jgi:sporulation and spore germination protein